MSIVRNSIPQPSRPAAYPQPVVSGVLERNPGIDDTLGGLFREMRQALRLTQGELALRLGTTVAVIGNLEAGRVRALPDWPETTRIVSLLGRMLSIDPRPILQRMSRQMGVEVAMPGAELPTLVERLDMVSQRSSFPSVGQSASSQLPAAAGRSSASPPSPTRGGGEQPRRSKRRKSKRGRILLAVATPMVMLASGVWVAQKQPRALHSAVSMLPRSMAQPIKASLNSLALTLAPRRDGLRWVEVDDPRTRKADKLRTVVR